MRYWEVNRHFVAVTFIEMHGIALYFVLQVQNCDSK